MDTYWFLVHIGSFTSMALLDISATQSNINLNSSHTIIGYNYKYFHVVLFSVDRNSNGKRSWAFDTYAYAGDMKTCLQNTFSKSIFKIMFCWYLDLADCSSNHFPDCVLETRRLAYKNLFPKISLKYFLLISRFGILFLKSLSWLCAGDMWSIPTRVPFTTHYCRQKTSNECPPEL